MKISIIILFSFILPFSLISEELVNSSSQFKNISVYDSTTRVNGNEIMPEIIGGIYSIQSKIIYPKEARENNIEGKVFIKCKITSEGRVKEIKVVKSLGFGCDEEAIRVVKDSKWIPGKINNVHADIYVSIPIIFAFKKT